MRASVQLVDFLLHLGQLHHGDLLLLGNHLGLFRGHRDLLLPVLASTASLLHLLPKRSQPRPGLDQLVLQPRGLGGCRHVEMIDRKLMLVGRAALGRHVTWARSPGARDHDGGGAQADGRVAGTVPGLVVHLVAAVLAGLAAVLGAEAARLPALAVEWIAEAEVVQDAVDRVHRGHGIEATLRAQRGEEAAVRERRDHAVVHWGRRRDLQQHGSLLRLFMSIQCRVVF